MKRAEIYRELAKKILGKDLYDDCYSFFRECLIRKSMYKIILTRRCFSLFKIFSVILKADGIENEYGTIITDNAVSLNMEEIRRALNDKNESGYGSASVLIIDDIIIYGRTINELLNRIFDSVNTVPFFGLRVICMVKSTGSIIDEKYKDLILSRYGASSVGWKKYSYKFSKLIKAADISNTSYIVSYRGSLENKSGNFAETCSQKMYFINNDELNELNVKPYVLSVSLKEGNFCGLVRVYIYNKIRSFLIAPLIILNEMDMHVADNISRQVAQLYCDGAEKTKVLLERGEKETKMRMLTLLASHVLLNDFAKKYGVPLTATKFSCEELFDNKEIIEFNFGKEYSLEFEAIGKKILVSESDLFTYKSDGIYDNTKIFENFIFKKAMQDNAAAKDDASKRREGFWTMLNGESLFDEKYAGNIMNTLDNGIAALKGVVSGEKFRSLLYSGEQAFRVASNVCPEILPALYQLEKLSYLYDKNSYSAYMGFLKYCDAKKLICSDKIQQLKKYIDVLEENGQQISDVTYMEATDDDGLAYLAEDFFEKQILEKVDV